MKKGKSPVAANDLTTPQKKLKQARLPFKLLSDVSPKPETPPSRKRKLSTPLDEVAPKIGKVSIENDLKDALVLISDDDSKDVENSTKDDGKTVNPLAKLVDTAWKKKLQKTKAGKKKKSAKNKHKNENSENSKEPDKNEAEPVGDDNIEDVVMMDLSEGPTNETKASEAVAVANKPVRKTRSSIIPKKTSSPSKICEKNNNKKAKATSLKKTIDSSEINVSIVIDDDSVDPDDITENRQLEKQDEMSQTLKTTTPSKADKKGKTFNTPKKNTEKESDKQPKYSLETSKRTRGSLSNSPKKSPEKEEGLDSSQKSNKSTKVTENPTEITEKSTKSTEVTKKSDKSSEVTEKSTEDTEKTKPEPLTTPKRTRGSLTKDTSKASLNDSSNSNLNSSQSSLMVTPKQVKKTDSQDKTGAEGSTPLTPKQLKRKLDSAKKRDEREKEKQEREQKRLQEKEERDKVKKEREDTKRREREEKEEAKKREREEKEEAKKKEKEEKERQRETEKKLREEKEEQKKREREEKEEQKKREREEKEEQRKKEKEAKEEEKRKQETEKQEQELKKKKAAEAFANFFVPKQKIDKEVSIGQVSGNTNILSSFTIKSDMRLAPTVRSDFNDDRKGVLDRSIETQGVGCEDLYVKSLKSGKAKPESSEKTWPLSERDDDVMIVEDELPPIDGDGSVITCESVAREKMRPKLFRFHENRRPPYWGTWRKKSVFVKPRRPFGQDEKLLDYSIDSDDEWEEEAEGESLDGSVAGSDTEPQDDEYELDNDVFVPHGYLSDEEATMDEEDVLKLSPEAQKARLKNLEDEFATELKKPTEKLKPRLYGLIWETSDGQKPEKCVDALWNYFGRFAMMIGDIDTLLKPAAEPEETEKKKIKKKKLVQEGETPSPKSDKKRKRTEKEPKEKTPKAEKKPKTPDTKKNQLGINTFLKKMKT